MNARRWRPWPIVSALVLAGLTVGLALRSPSPNWGGLAAMVALYGGTYLLGLWAAGRAAGGTFRDLVLAGRRLGPVVGVFTMTATWVDGGYVNGTAEQTYKAGLLHVQAPWGYALSLVLGGLWFAPVMRRHGFTTLLDPFAQRFGTRVAAALYLPAATGEICWTAAILTALGTTFGIILDVDTSWSIVLSAAIVVFYTMTGGLWSVAITDVAQLLILMVGLAIVVPVVAGEVGGFLPAWAAYRARTAGAGPVNWWAWTDAAFLLVFGGIPWHVYFQRVLAARDEVVARQLSIAAGVGCLAAAVAPALIGILATGVDWQARGLAAPEPALVLPYVLRHLTPPIVAAIGLGAVAAAVMSSVDSSILSASAMASWNVYRPLVRPEASSAHLAAVLRRTILIVGIAATLIALEVRSIYTLWVLCSDLVYCMLFPQLVLALWDPRANRYGAWAGLAVAAVVRASAGEVLLGLPPLIPLPLDGDGVPTIPIKSMAMLAGLATSWLVSRATSARCAPVALLPERL